jgi:hypothetical protein
MTVEHLAKTMAVNAWMNLSGVGDFEEYWNNTKDYWLSKAGGTI